MDEVVPQMRMENRNASQETRSEQGTEERTAVAALQERLKHEPMAGTMSS